MATNKSSTQPQPLQPEIALPDEEEKLRKQRAYQDRVMKRQEERKAKMQQRKMTNEHKQEETADFFWKEFNQQQSDINSLFEQFSSSTPVPTTLFKVSQEFNFNLMYNQINPLWNCWLIKMVKMLK